MPLSKYLWTYLLLAHCVLQKLVHIDNNPPLNSYSFTDFLKPFLMALSLAVSAKTHLKRKPTKKHWGFQKCCLSFLMCIVLDGSTVRGMPRFTFASRCNQSVHVCVHEHAHMRVFGLHLLLACFGPRVQICSVKHLSLPVCWKTHSLPDTPHTQTCALSKLFLYHMPRCHGDI